MDTDTYNDFIRKSVKGEWRVILGYKLARYLQSRYGNLEAGLMLSSSQSEMDKIVAELKDVKDAIDEAFAGSIKVNMNYEIISYIESNEGAIDDTLLALVKEADNPPSVLHYLYHVQKGGHTIGLHPFGRER